MHPAPGGNAVYEETAALLDWGFTHGSSARAVGTLAEPLSERRTQAGGAPGKQAAPGGATGAAGAPAGDRGPSAWRLLEGGAGTAALLAGGLWALRRRLRSPAAASGQSGGGRHRR